MTINIAVGKDPGRAADLLVMQHSIRARASIPVAFRYLPTHEAFCQRPWERHQTNAFSLTRFYTPHLWHDVEWAVYMDADLLCLVDIKELAGCFDARYAVQVVQHAYTPKHAEKSIGHGTVAQTHYLRKNWSSLMVFNVKKALDFYPLIGLKPDLGLFFNQFGNIPDELIGSLPPAFNVLVGEDQRVKDAKILHFTYGNPTAIDYGDQPYARLWDIEFDAACRSTGGL